MKRAREPYDAVEGGKRVRELSNYELQCSEVVVLVPRLSAAITTPSLYFRATTEVPVTTGCWVC